MNMSSFKLALSALFAFAILSSNPSLAASRKWKKIEVPGAKCADGSPYSIYFNKKSKRKLVLELKPGGICWDKKSCFGPVAKTHRKIPKRLRLDTVISSKKSKRTPATKHSVIIFPYCTGDVFAGDHTAKYEGAKEEVHHKGRSNVLKSLEFIQKTGIYDFAKINDFILFGSSAGAIGGFVHLNNIHKLLPKKAKKTFISDSPGLHFGTKFWFKFSDEMLEDFQTSIDSLDLDAQIGPGLLSQALPAICEKFNDWNIGILQSTKDIVMSKIFGQMSSEEHRGLILGEEGVLEVTKDIKNCSTWIPDTRMHTFLLFKWSAALIKVNGKKASQYVKEVYQGGEVPNYR